MVFDGPWMEFDGISMEFHGLLMEFDVLSMEFDDILIKFQRVRRSPGLVSPRRYFTELDGVRWSIASTAFGSPLTAFVWWT
ncbi:hypothetical protein TorRG33x02_093020 [Trema orientale]|uniref:Uncharacterized protein n=1 Tax=Trema orientale TaxID=63057 RepID=A0A2P5FAH7_TREOI|nr:hypothetical protein TorRG33x02_320540 [Trema orientale]PON94789.1 hypothetical protein TorRG33x02_093020 [Trema orientale]